MPTPVTRTEMLRLLVPFLGDSPADSLLNQLAVYLDVLLRWNARTNLTAVRGAAEIVARHFGESLAAAAFASEIAGPTGDWLDFGSGAGFPGLPAAMSLPGWRVTLAESQRKKAAFLAEVARQTDVPVEVWAARAEQMPPLRQFDIVSLRAVDNPETARAAAVERARSGGWLLEMLSEQQWAKTPAEAHTVAAERRLPTGSVVRLTQIV